jgi:hypothetical protein
LYQREETISYLDGNEKNTTPGPGQLVEIGLTDAGFNLSFAVAI